jgi:formylglycine-generating enzyme
VPRVGAENRTLKNATTVQNAIQQSLKTTLVLGLTSLVSLNASALITIDTVPVGNAGNANDPSTGYGAVGYQYGIGKFEVTLNQYSAFLNAVAATDTYGLYNSSMGTDLNIAGIARGGVSGSYTYSVIGSGNRPVTYVSWFDSARFVNWLQNGQPVGTQNATTTEQGAYTLNGALGGTGYSRNVNWIYALPSENEWYKAAYHQPASQGGDSDNYWLYPTANNGIPNSRNGSASDPNSANFIRNDGIANGFNGGYAVTDSTGNFPSQNYLTAAGVFSVADSFYGTFDQGGNVWEWSNAVIGSSRGLRGGSWNYDEVLMRSTYGNAFTTSPADELSNVGFRVAIVPEPSVGALAALGTTLLFWRRRNAR